MKKVALFVFNGDPMCFVHVLLNALDMKEKNYDVKVVIEGAAVKLMPEIAKETHPLHKMWKKVEAAGLVHCVCKACANKLGVLEFVQGAGLPATGDMSGHPSMSSYMEDGYEVITF
jgi:hypothetical protein